MTRFAHVSLVALALVFASACGSSEAPATAEAEAEAAVNAELGAEALVEEHDEGSVSWRIDPDGQVKASVSTSAGARVKEDLGGTLVYKVEGSEPKTVPLTVDAKTGLLVAAGPKLEADLTEVSYTVTVSTVSTVSGKPWTGVLHVPVGGTAELVASGKATAEAKLDAELVGPHGGTIQIVGPDRLELVANAEGETRVYVLDAELNPVKVEARTLRMGFVAETTTFANFSVDPGGFYFVARLGAAAINPLRVTASLRIGAVAHAAIWGFSAGVHIYAPSAVVRIATAPRVHFVLKGGFDGGFDVHGRAHTKAAVYGKGNNGRHVGQDGTWDRDSGGFKSDGRDDPRGAKAKSGDPGRDSKGGSSSKSSSHDSKGGGSAKSSGGSAKSGGGSAKGGGGSAKGGGGKGGKD